jgi:Arc/MetJ-type ribon-helix-helix transcriptional regulator
MKTTVELSEQVLNFVRSLAPESRRSLRSGLRNLEQDRGDIQKLKGDLAGRSQTASGFFSAASDTCIASGSEAKRWVLWLSVSRLLASFH